MNFRKKKKNKALLQLLEGTGHTWVHTVRSQVERERKCEGLEVCFYWGLMWRPRVSGVDSTGEFETKQRELKHRKGKTGLLNGHLLKSTKSSKTMEAAGLALYLVMCGAICLLEIVAFEVDASLK